MDAALRGSEAPVPDLKKKRAQDAWLIIPNADGRECRVCKAKDTDADLVTSGRTYMWAYPPDPVTKRNVGLVCIYCFRTHQARFMCKNWSIKVLVTKLGNDEEVRLG